MKRKPPRTGRSRVSRATRPFESTAAARAGTLLGWAPGGATVVPDPVGAPPPGHLSLVFSVSPGGITTAFDLTFFTLILTFTLPPMPPMKGLGLEHTTSTITWAVLVAVTG